MTGIDGDSMVLQPVTPPVSEKELGNCEECGEFTDELRLLGMKWICEKCVEDV